MSHKGSMAVGIGAMLAILIVAVLIPLFYFVIISIQGPLPTQPLTPEQSKALAGIYGGGDLLPMLTMMSGIVGASGVAIFFIFVWFNRKESRENKGSNPTVKEGI
jgi:hypothetical protein